MERFEVIVAVSLAAVIVGLLAVTAHSSQVNGEIVKAAIAAKVDPVTMCMLTKR